MIPNPDQTDASGGMSFPVVHYAPSGRRVCEAVLLRGDSFTPSAAIVTCATCTRILASGEGHSSTPLHDSPQIDVERAPLAALIAVLTDADRAFLIRALDTMQPVDAWTVADVLRREALKRRLA